MPPPPGLASTRPRNGPYGASRCCPSGQSLIGMGVVQPVRIMHLPEWPCVVAVSINAQPRLRQAGLTAEKRCSPPTACVRRGLLKVNARTTSQWSWAPARQCGICSANRAGASIAYARRRGGNATATPLLVGFISSRRVDDQRSSARGEPRECSAFDRAEDGRWQGNLFAERQPARLHGAPSGGPQYGPFADDAEDLQAFVHEVMEELAPRSAQERAEALNIVGLLVRRSRLEELEAMALAHGTRTPAPATGWSRPARTGHGGQPGQSRRECAELGSVRPAAPLRVTPEP